MKKKVQIVILLLIALAGIILFGVSIAARIQSTWPLCGALGCSISVSILNILRIRNQKEKENGSGKDRQFY